MLLINLVCAFVLQVGAQETYTVDSIKDFRNISNYTEDNSLPSPISQVDAYGGLAELMDRLLTIFLNRRSSRSEDLCKPFTLPVGGSEFKISRNPRGYCPYCCPLTNPKNHIRLYFSSKFTKGEVQLKPIRKIGALRAAGLKSNFPTVIFIHGFTEYGLGFSGRSISEAYLSRNENYNIILVDWGTLSTLPWYSIAVSNTRVVAAVLAKFLRFYNDTGELPIEKLHLIGFSLGSHVAGFIGKLLQGRIPRITGLDPAFPQFSLTDTTQRLSKSDAHYVDIIHTDGGAFGFPVSLGHADFYPNGGSFYQPGCEISKLSECGIFEQIVSCGHYRAVNFYVESVKNPTGFPATKCGIVEKGIFRNCRFIIHGYMGFPASKSTTLGNFYLTTNDHAPYSRPAEEQEVHTKTVNLIL